MPNYILNSLITHITTELAYEGIGFGKTKLVKLIYLVDVENYRARRKTLTGLEWIFHHYGPYAFQIDKALAELEFDMPQESAATVGGRAAIVFKPSGGVKSRLGERVPTAELRLVDRVIREWGETELNPLLNCVYFHTEPMRDAARGETLDFSKIPRRPRAIRAKDGARMSEERLNEYRRRFREAKAARAKLRRRPLDPPPRFDRVCQEALARMNEDERYRLPLGEVVISEDAKERIRKRGLLGRVDFRLKWTIIVPSPPILARHPRFLPPSFPRRRESRGLRPPLGRPRAPNVNTP